MAQSRVVANTVTADEDKSAGIYWKFLDDKKVTPIVRGLGLIAVLNIAIGLYMALFYAPMEKTMGDVQRIFYFHVPSAWVGFLAFFVVFVASVMFLWKRDPRWDKVALSAAEIGVVFITLVLITGPIWAKEAWGVYWVWDARLTTSLILWMIYIGYLMLRSTAEGERRARFAAVLAIIGFIDVPIIFISVQIWRTMHPELLIGADGGLAPQMTQTLMVCLLSFTWLFAFLLVQRLRLEQARDQLNVLREGAG